MGKYKLINNVLGWIVFAIASTVYLMTMEPTASFWDCGEFISSAYKLEVGHPPGAPFFMLTANLFTQLASDPSTVAKMVNTMSALFSGLTILFLFWSITHLARKIMVKDGEEASLGQMITVMVAVWSEHWLIHSVIRSGSVPWKEKCMPIHHSLQPLFSG